MDVKIADSIKEIEKKEWEEIAGNNVMSSYGWLKTIEETLIEPVVHKYFFISDSKGIMGASVCYISSRGDSFANFDHIIFGRFNKFAGKSGVSFLPALICSPLFSYGPHFLIREDIDPKKRMCIMNKLFCAIKETAKRKRLPVVFINVTLDESELDGLLQNGRYQKVLDIPLSYLDIKWKTFKDYRSHLKHISKNMWKSINREINKNKKEGVLIQSIDDAEEYEDRLHELANMNTYAHNKMPFMFSKAFFKKLKENLANESTIYVAVKDGNVTGFSVILSKDGMSSMPMGCVDHEMSGNDLTYFNILYYRPIMEAISSGKSRIYYGRGMYELKRRRGCNVKNIYFYYKPYNVRQKILAKTLFPLREIWLKRILPEKIREDMSKETDNCIS